MQDNELEVTMTRFLDKMRNEFKSDSYAAGYLSAWLQQLAKDDPWLEARIIRQLNYTMNLHSEKV